jgi:Tfp pilus assembly protein PilF
MLYTFVYSFVADHYQYLACIGLIALAAAGLETGLGRIAAGKPFIRPAVYGVLLATLGVLTWKQSGIFANQQTLWEAALRANPKSWAAQANLGTAAYKEGQLEDAIAHFQKALALNPDAAQVHYDLGLCFFQLGRFDDAIAQDRLEIASSPDSAATHINLGNALARKGESSEAEYRKALVLEPDNAAAHDNLGDELLKKGDVDEAIAHLQKAVQIEPRLADAQNSLGVALAEKGRTAEAMAQFQKALEPDSDNIQALDNLAWLLAAAPDPKLRDGVQALALAQQAAQLAGSENPLVLQTLAAAEAATGNYPEAAATAQRALDLAVKLNNGPLAGRLRGELKLYQASTPPRDSISHWTW